MKRVMSISALLGGFVLHANAMECGSTANRAGCVGPNGAAGYNRNTGQAGTYNRNTGQGHMGQPYQYNRVQPGTQIHGPRGSATKALEPGCAYVNGKRVCN